MENLHTQQGSREHERSDLPDTTALPDGGGRRETALPVWSHRLRLSGRCDVVEFAADGTPFPIEFKHGPKRPWLNDDIQVCAQALCLEEMFGRPVPAGALFHARNRRRRPVVFDAALRRETERTIAAVHALLAGSRLPPPVLDRRCEGCSLHPVCLPEVPTGASGAVPGFDLFTPIPESEIGPGQPPPESPHA